MFAFIELIFIILFVTLMVIGTALDRRYNESPKWWILGIAFVITLVYFWNKTDFSTVWTTVTDWNFWKPVVTYLAAGVAYSVLEFILSVRKMARIHSERWSKFIDTVEASYFKQSDKRPISSDWVQTRPDGSMYMLEANPSRNGPSTEAPVTKQEFSYRTAMQEAAAPGASKEQLKVAKDLVDRYLGRDDYNLSDLKRDFIEVSFNPNTGCVEPSIKRSRLASFIGCWTFLWPFYAVSLVLGDFLVEIFRIIGDFFSKLGGRFVRLTFSDVFKF